MTAIERRLREIIAQEGPITVDRFMALALGHYYATRDPLGAAGDFTTAPEISQMFGELIGLWAAHAWMQQGSPTPVALVELGPGRGTLMADALRAITRAAPAFRSALSVHLVETSPALRAKQQKRLTEASPRWHETIDTLPVGPMIVIANEFFDALPTRQFQCVGGVWRERMVGLGEEGLVFGLSPEPPADGPRERAADGTVVERSDVAIGVAGTLGRRIAGVGGAILVIDYGALEGGHGDTLQAMHGHAFADPLTKIGDADLTVHVDFAALRAVFEGAGLSIDWQGTQADFLDMLGIGARAATLRRSATQAQIQAIDDALGRLTDRTPKGMGALFKVLAASRPASR